MRADPPAPLEHEGEEPDRLNDLQERWPGAAPSRDPILARKPKQKMEVPSKLARSPGTGQSAGRPGPQAV